VSHAAEQRSYEFVGKTFDIGAILFECAHALPETPVELVGNQREGEQSESLSKEHMVPHRIAHWPPFPLQTLRARPLGAIIAR